MGIKRVLYKGFEILVGASYTKVIPDEDKKLVYEVANQVEAEQFVDQFRDEAGTHPINCEFCGAVPERSELNTTHWKDDKPITFVIHECQKKDCRNARDYYFDLGKAMAKGEI